MKKNVPTPVRADPINAVVVPDATYYVLRLYIIGSTPHSVRATANIRKLCDQHLEGRYDLEVVDISQYPALAGSAQIIAAPTLIKELPLPLRRFIGDMSQTERLLLGLDLGDPSSSSAKAD
ncbi:MAG: circadian clock KaiB family protein [Azospirillaceae bacterium]|nr:circadian clock KaiB family protein [Azospirillaceae bacterium]